MFYIIKKAYKKNILMSI